MLRQLKCRDNKLGLSEVRFCYVRFGGKGDFFAKADGRGMRQVQFPVGLSMDDNVGIKIP